MTKGIICFISYSSLDKAFVRRLVRDLESQGTSVWHDEREVHIGESITSKIAEGLASCDVFIVVLSSNIVQSEWVKEGLRIAYQRRIETAGGRVIMPVLIEKCPIPAFLKDYKYVSFEEPANYEESLRGLYNSIVFRNSLIRKYQDIFPGNIIIDYADITGEISGSKYEKIYFIEKYRLVLFRPAHRYIKEIHPLPLLLNEKILKELCLNVDRRKTRNLSKWQKN